LNYSCDRHIRDNLIANQDINQFTNLDIDG